MADFSCPPFKDESLWQQAMTHRSFVNEVEEELRDNERLEFLGDAVLDLIREGCRHYLSPCRHELAPLSRRRK